jgi:polyhydroxyalkanoate synthesis regulator phasin
MVMEYDKLIRAESIVNKQSIFDLQEAIQSIVDDMEDGDFKLQDAKDYIQVLLDEILGDQ